MKLPQVHLSRRQALGVAAGGAVGAVALHFGLDELTGSAPRAASKTTAGSWASPLGDKRAMAAHLLRRAGFGYNEAELTAAASLSYDDLVDQLVNQKPDPLAAPADATNHTEITTAWYTHMATTTAQFPERATLFWHGVLTSDYRNARLPFVFQQNALYRSAGLTDLRSLLVATTHDPLMMRYLNLDASTAAAPNENYARELMELFTLGPGNYSETDVREAARALSGLRIDLVDASGKRIQAPKYDKANPKPYTDAINALVKSGARFQGVLNPKLHDTASKTFLGHTGNLGADDVVDIVLAQEAAAPFVTGRAMTFFGAPNASTADIAAIAAQFRSSRYDIRTLMRAIFRSSAFTDPANYRSLVRSPTDYMVAAMRALNRTDLAAVAARSAAGMDQVLYDPPNVAGWPANSGWVSSSTLLARINFATAVTTRMPAPPSARAAVGAQLDNVVSSTTANALNAATTEADRWFALLCSPEFQLK